MEAFAFSANRSIPSSFKAIDIEFKAFLCASMFFL